MIISHSKKFIFFRVAKTGSTTAEVMLRLSNAFDLAQDTLTATKEFELPHINRLPGGSDDMNWAHATPQQLIDLGVMTIEQLREYSCYAFVRPIEGRFVSAYLHASRSHLWGRAGVQPEQFIERWRDKQPMFSLIEIIGRPQTDWFFVGDEQVTTPLDFADYENELRYLLALLGGNQFEEIPRINRATQHQLIRNSGRRQWARNAWRNYPEVQREVHERYAADHQFYTENFGGDSAALRKCG